MKKINKLIKSIYLFFYYLTPKGKEEKYWKKAGESLEKKLIEKGLKEIEVKNKCVSFAKKVTSRKKLSRFHLATITEKKHQKELQKVNVKINKKTLEFKDA